MTTPIPAQPAAAQKRTNSRTLSDLLVDYLELLGVEYVFGIPGVHVIGLYEALARSAKRGGPRAVLTRHESGAAFMAAGYARETGKLGVCCATAGPGITNAITGIASAHSEHLPVLVLSGQAVTHAFGLGAIQESSPYEAYFPDIIDATGMLQHCTTYNSVVTTPLQLEGKVAAAMTAALQGPVRGVAHLAIPPNILEAPAQSDSIAYPGLGTLLDSQPDFVEAQALEKLWAEMETVVRNKGRVALLVGHECAGASEEILALAEMLDAPIMTTVRGRAWVDPYHPLARGIFGPLWGHPSAFQVLDEPLDLLLAVGTSLTQAATGAWDAGVLNDRMIHIHPTETFFTRAPMARLHVRGVVKRVFRELIGRLQAAGVPANSMLEQRLAAREQGGVPPQIKVQKQALMQADSSPIKPQRLMHELATHCPPETRFMIDIGNSLPWTAHYLFQQHPENYRILFGQSSMGSSPGTAVGIAMGARGTPVVAVIGDGAFLMYGQEITVAVSEGLPVIFVVLNDQALGMVKNRHSQTSEAAVKLDVPPVDFAALAEAMGAHGVTVREPADFAVLDWRAMCARKGPTLVNVYIDAAEMLPQGIS